jgi:hypothetical protein
MNFILNFIPEAIFYLGAFIGIIGILISVLLSAFPFIQKFQSALTIAFTILFGLSIYYIGGINQKEIWEAKVKNLEIQLAEAKAKKAEVDTKIVTKVITKRQVIKERGDAIVEYIDRIHPVPNCPVPEKLITAHNAAAKNEAIVEVENNVTTTTHDTAAKKPTLKLVPKK